ncbi:PBP1A family penicillin-binding protein [Paratractidigestivibacter sp.]|uniref:transglycosylase domain-containing protein n=1 Tax=Paratractidigestivibacter sp. TaxID=2847316 RepID=UPI002ABE89E9|nr:PBP1A family penicillin-binding protein [Paratractidigestivibacter sp.]
MGIRTRRAHKHSRTHIVGFGLAGAVGFVALLIVAACLSMGGVVFGWLEDLPDYTSADSYAVAEPTRIYDASGNEIATYYLQQRRSVDLDQVSPYVLKGTVDTEDKRFYQHSGVDPQGILRAVVGQITGKSGQGGGSSITQQLVRNTILSDEQFEMSLKRKVREAYIAIQMEKMYTKDQILNMYVNTIYYGNSAYGIEAASITYFNKHASELTLAEAATLVGLPNSPTIYDPFRNPENCVSRRNLVLDRMLEAGDITQEEHDAAQAEELMLNPGELTEASGSYPFFTDYVRELLLENFSSDTIMQGGLKVYTTLDPDYQAAAEAATDKYVSAAGNDDVSAALVCIDNSTGYIKAMVGGQHYGTDLEGAQVNLATSKFQAGSSFKTFTLLAALNEGMSPTVILNCNSPMKIGSTWNVQNIDNHQYGYITLDRATQVSSNTGYAQLIDTIGVDKLITMCKLVGIDSTIDPYGTATLGTSSVSPLEMAEGYSTIANNGEHRDTVAIVKIENRNGSVIYKHEDAPEQVVDSAVAQDTREVLENVVSYGTGSTVLSMLNINQPVGGKTGTTESYDNLWFCGFSPQVTTVVRFGRRDGTNKTAYYQGSHATTSNTAQPIWATFMNSILAGKKREEFPEADHTASYKSNSSWTFAETSSSYNNGYYSSSSYSNSNYSNSNSDNGDYSE